MDLIAVSMILSLLAILLYFAGRRFRSETEKELGKLPAYDRMLKSLRDLTPNRFAFFVLDDAYMQARYHSVEASYELAIPLRGGLERYEKKISEYLDAKGVTWNLCEGIAMDVCCAQDCLDCDGGKKDVPRESIHSVDMRFINAFTATPEDAAGLAKGIFEEVYGGKLKDVYIESSAS